MTKNSRLTPLLVVRGAAAAIGRYARTLGIRTRVRFARFASRPARVEEDTRIRGRGARAQGRIHLVVGPVGAGKTTYALALARRHSALRLTLDEWMTRLFAEDRPEDGVMAWYVERAARSVEQIWHVAKDAVETGADVVLEVGLLRRDARRRFCARIDQAGLRSTIHALDAPRDVRRERVETRNRERGETFSMVVPAEIFERASDFWEPLDAPECEGRDVRFVRTG